MPIKRYTDTSSPAFLANFSKNASLAPLAGVVRNSLVIKRAKMKTLILLYLQIIEYYEQHQQYTKTHINLTGVNPSDPSRGA